MLTAIALSALLLTELPPAAKEAGLSEAEYAKATSGEVVVKGETFKTPDGKDAGRGRAWLVINAAPAACYDTLYAYEQAPEYLPRLKKVSISNKSEKAMEVTQELKVVLTTVRYTMDFAFDKQQSSMSWVLNQKAKNDIKDTAGSWRFKALPDNKTLLDYSVSVDTGTAVPQFLSDYMTKRDLPDVLINFKKRVESGGKWKKD